VVERAATKPLFAKPLHPYTRGLFKSLVRVDRRETELQTIEGNVPSPTHFPSGCRFRTRCPRAEKKCEQEPPLVEIEPARWSACWFADELKSQPMAKETAA